MCVCVWVDNVFILLSNPFHLRSLGCSRVLPNGQSRPTKLAFGSGTEMALCCSWVLIALTSGLASWEKQCGGGGRGEQGKCFTPCCSHLSSIASDWQKDGVFWQWSKELLAACVSKAAGGQ